jgi:hypothetical protein
VDDFLLFSDSKEQLHEMLCQIREFLYRFRLTLHENKSRVHWCRDGFPFLGAAFASFMLITTPASST